MIEMMQPLAFTNITQAQFAVFQQKASVMLGQTIDADNGQATKMGFTVGWNYVRETQTLTIQCLKKPFFFSEASVEARIKGVVTGEQA